MAGPYETDAQARADASDIYDAMRRARVRGVGREECRRRLLEVCYDAGITLGAYDRRILDRLACYEPETVQAMAGLIARAYAAGLAGRHPAEEA